MDMPKIIADFIAECSEKISFTKTAYDGGVKIKLENEMARTGFITSLTLDKNPEESDLLELIDLYKACRARILAFHEALVTGSHKNIKNFGVAS